MCISRFIISLHVYAMNDWLWNLILQACKIFNNYLEPTKSICVIMLIPIDNFFFPNFFWWGICFCMISISNLKAIQLPSSPPPKQKFKRTIIQLVEFMVMFTHSHYHMYTIIIYKTRDIPVGEGPKRRNQVTQDLNPSPIAWNKSCKEMGKKILEMCDLFWHILKS